MKAVMGEGAKVGFLYCLVEGGMQEAVLFSLGGSDC